MPHSFDVYDETTEKYIEFMKPMFNGKVSSIEYESLLIQNSLCHDTYF
jgi:hypothetical protein